MRSLRVLSLVAGAALLAACGDDNGPSGNDAPTADFTFVCDLLECTFTDASTDGDGSIASYSWNFDDGSAAVTTADPVHTYAAAGTYDVTLTVTDNEGATDNVTKAVTVSDVPNALPTADFTFACSDLTCDFENNSSDQDGSIASRSWNFGDNTPESGQGNPSHTYAAAGTYDVELTVTDDRGGTGTVTKPVTVTAPAGGGLSASFEVSCSAARCTITNTTEGATGAVVTWDWDFGDGQTSTEQDPAPVQYSVNEVTGFTITLMVNSDGNISQASRQVTVSPAAGLTCGGVACTLTLDQAATVRVTLVSSSCEAQGNTFVITQPVEEILFTDGCFAPVDPEPGSSFDLNSGAAYAAGTALAAEVRTGVAGAESPQLQVTGTFTDGWTLKFDDGFVGPGEPDFNDLVILVKATPAGP